MDFYGEMLEAAPPERDPFLARTPAHAIPYVGAGLDLSRTIAYLEAGDTDAARSAFAGFFDDAPLAVYRMFREHLGRRFPELLGAAPASEGTDREDRDR